AHAMELLGDASLSISEIGERCGYASVSYFGEVFKKTFGKSPSEYRITPPLIYKQLIIRSIV
ncbi:MAG: AraC family transcriptional regulator, partial [Muribaculaceae bacterium]|nr:AraC family transcriptional regulator [Muribaculaceae bacterium]